MKRIPNLSLRQICPEPGEIIDLNTCHDPDCGNFGVQVDHSLKRPRGPGAAAALAALGSNSATSGLGKYKLSSRHGLMQRRVSSAFEYQGDPHAWQDRRVIECQHDAGSGPCGR